MKILLDENIDVRFKKCFSQIHEVFTIKDMTQSGIKNGELIQLLEQHHFNFWIVVDKNIAFQQNTSVISFKIIVLDVFRNTLMQIEKLLPKILEAINNPTNDNVIVIKESIQ